VRSERRRATDAGYTTVEAAVALPALVLVSPMLLWAELVGSAKVRCVEAARAAARGDPAAAALGQAAVPPGASVSVSAAGGPGAGGGARVERQAGRAAELSGLRHGCGQA
jgi:hypothetical protein